MITATKSALERSSSPWAWISGASLALIPFPVHAQRIPTWVVIGVFSPLLAILLCVVLGALTRSACNALLHGAIILAWVILFLLASFFLTSDYLIWTPLVLYLLHSVLLVILVGMAVIKRLSGMDVLSATHPTQSIRTIGVKKIAVDHAVATPAFFRG